MATIQIRAIPDDVYDSVRKRARAAGQSIQSYMRDVVIEFASTPTTEEVLAEMARARATDDLDGVTRESILDALDADRL